MIAFRKPSSQAREQPRTLWNCSHALRDSERHMLRRQAFWLLASLHSLVIAATTSGSSATSPSCRSSGRFRPLIIPPLPCSVLAASRKFGRTAVSLAGRITDHMFEIMLRDSMLFDMFDVVVGQRLHAFCSARESLWSFAVQSPQPTYKS